MSKNKLFEKVQLAKPPRSVFDLSHDVKMSFRFGKLYPTLVMECVPGDNVKIGCEALVRFMPLIAPLMHIMNIFVHYFFVPTRLLWEGWEDFITQTPFDGSKPTHPYITIDEAAMTTLNGGLELTYFGLPDMGSIADPGFNINPFPFAAYQLIYNEYYRDQNLSPEIDFELDNGDNSANIQALCTLRRRAWEHDYLTSALPFAQKGPAVTIPMSGTVELANPLPGAAGKFVDPNTGAVTEIGDVLQSGVVPNGAITINGNDQIYDPNGTLVMTNAESTINDLRRAYRLQEWYERHARGGSRYIESILAHFGVRSSDARLQRPEYITGTKAPVTISEVLNTTGSEALPQGNMAGHGISVTAGKYGSYYVEEHGYIIGIMSCLPRTSYMDQIHKMWLKTDEFTDYYWPEFAQIGEQEIKKREVHWNHIDPDGTFGYIPRYSEYKFMNGRVAGNMLDTLDYWHLSRSLPTDAELNQDFIECLPDADRIFAAGDADDYLIAHIYHQIRAVRHMPFYGNPTI